MNCLAFTALLLTSASAFALPSLAIAQTTLAASEVASTGNEVVVTGSRVIKNGNNSPTPVTVLTMDDAFRTQPTTVADALNDLPVFSSGRTPLANPNTGSTVQQGGGNTGANVLNLRNLGQNRTLILYDGHRMAPTSATGLVDVDQIPSLLLQRVDVVTGGVSAVYGSDAVTGVVNFVTDRNFNGVKLKAQYGVTGMGDDKNMDMGFALGRTLFGGHGHIEMSYEYSNDNGISARSSRDPNHLVYSIQGSGSAAAPFFLTPNGRVASSTFGGLILTTGGANPNTGVGCTVLACQTFKQNGVLSPFIHGTPTVPGNTTSNEVGGDGIYYDTSLKAGLMSNQAFGRFDYDFTDTMHGYAEVAFNDKINTANVFWQSLGKQVLSSTDAYLPAAYQAQLLAAKQTTFQFSKQMADLPNQRTHSESKLISFNAGLSGDFLKDYRWELGYLHAYSDLIPTLYYNTNQQKRAASLDAVVNPANGQIVCNAALTNPSVYGSCVPLNPFGPTSDSLAADHYFTAPSNIDIMTTLDDVSGNLGGAPFSTWAGPVNLNLSFEWRKLSEKVNSTVPNGVLADCTGLRYNCVQGTTTLWSDTTAARPLASQTVAEGAFETDIPLVKDMPFAQAFNLNGAVRITNYSTKGTYVPWKVGVDWHVNDEIRLRGTRSQDIRAPSLDDLFSPISSSISNGTTTDPLTKQTVTGVLSITTSNPNLTAEVGHTWTGGVVYRPTWAPGFSVSVDYFNILVDNAIVAILGGNVTANNACVASGGLSPYCATVIRPLPYSNTTAANNLTANVGISINVAQQFSQGVDIEANYATKFLGRPAVIRFLSTYQPQILYEQPFSVTLNQAGAGFGNNNVLAAPIWQFTALVRFQPIDNLTLDFQTRWRTDLHEAGDPTLVFTCCAMPSAWFTNAAATYQLKSDLGQTEMFFNVQNLFNNKGPHAAPFTNTSPGQQFGFVAYDDPIGRSFIVGVRFKH